MSKLVFIYLLLLSFFLSGCAQPRWEFIVTGDSRDDHKPINTAILSELACEIVKYQPEFVLVSGDLVNGYTNQAEMESQFNAWRNTMQPVYEAGIGVYVVRGNHDIGKPAGVSAWNKVFGDMPDTGPEAEKNLTYSFVHKNALVIGVDEYINKSKVNQVWLDGQFSVNTRPHIFVFGHEPAFKVQHADCLDNYPSNRDAFWGSIENAGGRTYFCGHDHFYDHARVDNDGQADNDVHQYVVGTAGAPLRNWLPLYDGDNSNYTVENINHAEQYGYVLVRIDGLDVRLTWMERIGPGKYQEREVWNYTAAPACRR